MAEHVTLRHFDGFRCETWLRVKSLGFKVVVQLGDIVVPASALGDTAALLVSMRTLQWKLEQLECWATKSTDNRCTTALHIACLKLGRIGLFVSGLRECMNESTGRDFLTLCKCWSTAARA